MSPGERLADLWLRNDPRRSPDEHIEALQPDDDPYWNPEAEEWVQVPDLIHALKVRRETWAAPAAKETGLFDASTHGVVLQYAEGQLGKGKSPAAAAKSTAKALHGAENLFIASGRKLHVDADKLEAALWRLLAERVIAGFRGPKAYVKPGKEHFALSGVISEYNQKYAVRMELKERIIKGLGFCPFPNDDPETPTLLRNGKYSK